MTFAIRKEVSLAELLRGARWQEVKCTDPDCSGHKAPILYACSVSYRNHLVRVVQDWDCFSAQIDGNPRQMVENVSRAQMLEYVEQAISKE